MNTAPYLRNWVSSPIVYNILKCQQIIFINCKWNVVFHCFLWTFDVTATDNYINNYSNLDIVSFGIASTNLYGTCFTRSISNPILILNWWRVISQMVSSIIDVQWGSLLINYIELLIYIHVQPKRYYMLIKLP